MELPSKHQEFSSNINQDKDNDNNDKSTIENIPRETLHLIFIWLTGTDIENISKSSRNLQALIQDDYLWSVMTKARFPGLYEKTLLKIHDKKNHGNVPQENPISWRDIYMSKDDMRLSAGKNMGMLHARLPYWEIVRTKESVYGVIAKLHSVCWFDLHGIIEGVPQGKYRIQWRMRLLPSARRNEALDFKASIIPRKKLSGDGEDLLLSYTMPREFYSGKELVTHRWFLLTVPGEIKIEDYFSDIRVTHEKRTNWWKGGLEVDWVGLQPSSEVTDDGLLIEYENGHTTPSSSSHNLTVEETTYDDDDMWSSSWGDDSDNDEHDED